ncbi:hypothetical protein TNCT_504351 [Trichonephila clavata]|uniref:Uncharacterized protein n=1 Tax=Trichonephila clavata TaxID=2740835 RepID=A0A8X6F140_TRICU|nr:hypothetical protein TNCT_504351 [Trichonephila clavata]
MESSVYSVSASSESNPFQINPPVTKRFHGYQGSILGDLVPYTQDRRTLKIKRKKKTVLRRTFQSGHKWSFQKDSIPVRDQVGEGGSNFRKPSLLFCAPTKKSNTRADKLEEAEGMPLAHRLQSRI